MPPYPPNTTTAAADLANAIRSIVLATIRDEQAKSGIAAGSRRLLSAREAAVEARCRPTTVLHACESGSLRATRRGIRNWTITDEALKSWIDAGCPTDLTTRGQP